MYTSFPPVLMLVAPVLMVPWLACARALDPVTAARNKAAMREFRENLSQGRLEIAQGVYDHAFRNHRLSGYAALAADQEAVHSEKRAFLDLRLTEEMLAAEGDLVWTSDGTHSHWGYGGLRPTGARIRMRGITVWQIVDGKIRDEWTTFKESDAYGQGVTLLRSFLVALAACLFAAVVVVERAAIYVTRKVWARLRLARSGAGARRMRPSGDAA